MKGEHVKFAVGVDTSGSISNDDLQTFLSEIYSMFKQYNSIELYLLSFDAEICNDKVIYNESELMDFQFLGGGGTDFRPVFKRLEEENYNGLVMFSDGYGTFPEETDINTLWIMTSDVIAPIGETIKFEL
jgi:predicted metal-dependent peptidase